MSDDPSDSSTAPPRPRSTARKQMARALWHIAPGRTQLQIETLLPAAHDEVLVETAYTGISRGTERLVSQGLVPKAEWQNMRAPFQAGDFPFPVKYGYSAAGRVVDGPQELLDANVFCLFPHQDQFVVPASTVVSIPPGVPPRRATLAANMETALNAVWDAAAGPGDRIAVVGAGIVGLLTAHLTNRFAGTDVSLIDTNPARRSVADMLGVAFRSPDNAPEDCDIVFHTSATAAGLETAIACAGMEATVVEMSWYGERAVTVGLGGALHSRRLRIVSSQVGQVSATRRPRWTYRRRLAKALALLDDAVLDHLVDRDVAFTDLPDQLATILNTEHSDLPPVVSYKEKA